MKNWIVGIGLAILLSVSGCEKHSHDHDEHKVPGTFILRLIPARGTDTITAQWNDPDGPGGNQPTVTELRLKGGLTYTGRLEILATDGDTLTSVIQAQGTEHQLFWSISGAAQNVVQISVSDRDSRGMPLGLETSWQVQTVPAATPGNVRMILYHYEPNKKDGISPSPETDADITIPLQVIP
ncbi:MAG: hypothetical protein RML15_03495 [Bacteroidota bacterium]|nr:hypothetical protein [Bacteroidota bacterium]